ncbi:MAG TPA: type II secretion system protein [Clostridium sp.]|uniref:type II secretion system protein n=1 Tax=Clostridium sp. TaxID=1506 RepID=UPI002F95D3D7
MKKKGFTYIEIMIAISIFTILIVMIMKLNITSEGNLNKQTSSQKMMFVAQQQIEKYKSTLSNIGSYENGFTQDSSGYYIVVRGDNSVTDNTNVYLVTVWVRKSSTDNSNEIKLQSHVLKD